MKMTKLMTLATLPVALGLLACEARDADDTADMAADSAAMATEQIAPAPATFTLTAVENSGHSGEVIVASVPGGALDQTSVTVTLNASPNMADTEHEHAAMIHSGTCDNVGAVVETLDPVKTEGGTTKTSTTEVNIPLTTITDGNHVVAIHQDSGDEPGAVVACAAVTGTGGYMDNMN
ncbi:MAG: hypothetical protein ACREL6_07885, partial [Gemmatimonadales bacterium]